ncbi:MAG TPA: hypothetical protein V6D34_06950 [Candidatus Sericytochromatia bacterium]
MTAQQFVWSGLLKTTGIEFEVISSSITSPLYWVHLRQVPTASIDSEENGFDSGKGHNRQESSPKH